MEDKYTLKGKTLIIMVGISHSGKSYYARKLAKEHKYPIVSTDAIREVMFQGKFSFDNNTEVFNMAMNMILSLFVSGAETVIYDACNITAYARTYFEPEGTWKVKYVVMDTDVEKCVERANERGLGNMESVIRSMADSIVFPTGKNVEII